MVKQLYWEDVEIGEELTPLPKIPTTQMLVKWAGASGDFNPAHMRMRLPIPRVWNGPMFMASSSVPGYASL